MSLLNIWQAQFSRISWQLCRWSVRFIFLIDMCSVCWQKCEPRPKLFLRLDIFSTFRGVHALIFEYVPQIVFGLHGEQANFYREKRNVAFVTGHLFTFLVVSSLVCLVTTQILIFENQTILKAWNSIKNDCGRFVKNQMQSGRFVKKKKKDIQKRASERWGLLTFCC